MGEVNMRGDMDPRVKPEDDFFCPPKDDNFCSPEDDYFCSSGDDDSSLSWSGLTGPSMACRPQEMEVNHACHA